MTRVFTKSGPNPLGEAAGLRWLAQAEASGGANVAAVLAVDQSSLQISHVAQAPPSPQAAAAFGRALAHTHAAGAPWWGCPPQGWPGPDWVGASHTPLVAERAAAPATWGEFYASCRVEPFARRLRESGAADASQVAIFDRLAARLSAGELDHPQPQLVRAAGCEVARVHGDMWSGNVLYDGTPKGATLIDPMAHGGHAETDLGTLAVFGFPHLEQVYAGYDEESPLAQGWRERVDLHRLGIVIMHAVMFGGGYLPEALGLARRYI